MNESTIQTVLDANKVVRQLKAESVQLMFQPLGNRDVTKLVIYSDASLGNLPDGGTQGGHVILVSYWRGGKNFTPVLAVKEDQKCCPKYTDC